MNGRIGLGTWLMTALLGGACAMACSQDEQALGDHCPNPPLYTYVYDGTTWQPKHVLPDGGFSNLTASELAVLASGEQGTSIDPSRCFTPPGHAQTLGVDAGH